MSKTSYSITTLATFTTKSLVSITDSAKFTDGTKERAAKVINSRKR